MFHVKHSCFVQQLFDKQTISIVSRETFVYSFWSLNGKLNTTQLYTFYGRRAAGANSRRACAPDLAACSTHTVVRAAAESKSAAQSLRSRFAACFSNTLVITARVSNPVFVKRPLMHLLLWAASLKPVGRCGIIISINQNGVFIWKRLSQQYQQPTVRAV